MVVESEERVFHGGPMPNWMRLAAAVGLMIVPALSLAQSNPSDGVRVQKASART
jgi:hypothetical protein